MPCVFLRLMSGLALAGALALPLAGTAQQPPPADAADQAKRQLVQPGNNAPVWREVQSGQQAYTSIKGQETNVLIQPAMKLPGQPWTTAGEAWRLFRNNLITPIGGWFVAFVVAAIAVFYWWKGPVKLHERPTGRLIRRFTPFERYIHWVLAIAFCILGATGLIILVGKDVLLPVLGYTLFAWLTSLSKNLHNFVGPIFVLSFLVFVVRYIRDNFPRAYDFKWFASAGGMFGGKHVPSGKYNAGEKVWFWAGVVLLSTVVSITGLILNFPNFDQVRSVMIQANIIHAIASIAFIILALGHIYMGTIGVEGAYQNMRYGYTDETWAKEHHQLWYEDVKSGKVKAETAKGVPAAPQVQH
ncbi:MAG: formate dehydrogenase subunit gamma [Burkholderiales bacterium]